MPKDTVLFFLKNMLMGLAHAHSRDVMHQDIKPENIFVMECEGQEYLKIGDFGMSRILVNTKGT